MLNLISLLLFVLSLTALSYIVFRKNLLSPSFILNLIFLVGVIFAILGNSIFWNEMISTKVTVAVPLFLSCFMLGEFIVDLILRKKYNAAVIKNNSIPVKPVVFNNFKLGITITLFVIGILSCILLFVDLYNAAIAIGYVPGALLLAHIRSLLHNHEYSLPIYISVLDFFTQAIGFVSIFMFARQLFGGKKRWSLMYALCTLPMFFSHYISSSRDVFVLDAILAITSIYYFGCIYYKKISLKKFFLAFSGIIVAFIGVFLLSGLGTGKIGGLTSSIESILTYGGSSIVLFDKGLNSTGLFDSTYFGSYSFGGLILLLKKFFPQISQPNFFLPFIVLGNGTKSNIYTTFFSQIADFGYIGAIFYVLLIGAFFSFLKNISVIKKGMLIKYFFFFSLFYVVYALFASFTNLFLSVTQILQVIFSIVVFVVYEYSEKIFNVIKKHKTASNLIVAFVAQAVSLLLSITMSFFVPKFFGVTEYSYWQLFLFYATYVGFFHLGYIDGLYLIYGGKNKEDINKSDITSQFIIFTISQTLVATVVCAIWCPLIMADGKRWIVILATGIYLIFSNIGLFIGYIFQAINKIKTYSMSVMLEKLLFLITVICFFAFKIGDSVYLIAAYVVYRVFFFAYLAVEGGGIIWGKPSFSQETLKNMWVSLKRGFNLMIASFSSLLIMGVSRMIIDSVWGLEAFGKYSFSISICSFVLAFLAQISVVFFPALRKQSEDSQKGIYLKMRNFLSLFLPVTYFAYFLFKFIVNGWLPNYSESVVYFCLMIPICLYDGKMQTLSNTYLKVLNKEKTLLVINLISLAVTVSLSLTFAYGFHNMTGVVISMILGVAIRSIIADYYLTKLMGEKFLISTIIELVTSVAFMTLTWFLDDWVGFVSLIVCYIGVLVYNRKALVQGFNYIKSFISKFTKEEPAEEVITNVEQN